jgi:hypothetical protein
MTGVVAGAGAGFHWMSWKHKEEERDVFLFRNKRRSRKSCKETDDHHLRRALVRFPSASSLARRLLLLLAMKLLGELVLKKESLGLESEGLGERLGAPEVLIYKTGKEIVAGDRGAYPKKFGKWRDSLNRTVVGSFGIQSGSYSV